MLLLLPHFSSFSSFFLSFPIILQHWTEAFLNHQLGILGYFSLFFSSFFFVSILHCFLLYVLLFIPALHVDDDNNKKTSQLNGAANRRRRKSRAHFRRERKASRDRGKERNHVPDWFSITLVWLFSPHNGHFTWFISLFSFLFHSLDTRHITHTRALLDFSFNDSAYTTLLKWSVCDGLTTLRESLYFLRFALPSTCDTLLNSDWKLPIKLNWNFFTPPRTLSILLSFHSRRCNWFDEGESTRVFWLNWHHAIICESINLSIISFVTKQTSRTFTRQSCCVSA